jgi:adenylate cyclase
MNDISSFGEWVKHRRRLMELTQEQLAQRIGCAVITLKKIERDERRPSQSMAELLASCLMVPQTERAQFLSMARGEFVPTTPSPDELRLPSYLATVIHNPPLRFVARQRELAQLQAHLDQALAFQSQIVFISGEAGRGKSSLLAEFARRAQQHIPDLLVLSGVCSAHGDIGDPYLPFRDVVAQLTGDVETRMEAGMVSHDQALRLWAFLPNVLRAIVEHGPSLVTTLLDGPALVRRVSYYAVGQPGWLVQLKEMIDQQQGRSSRLEQSQFFEQLRQLLQALAAQQPLLILLDDLQWIDSASLNLLFHLGRRFSRDRIMVVGAYRASEVNDTHPLTPVVTEFKRRFGDIQIDLEHFDPVESRAFVDALLDIEPNRLSEQFREKLFGHTKGYPLFTIELLHYLQERGNLIRDQEGQWIETIDLEPGDLPVRIEAVISQRLNRIDPALLELLRVAAVEGEVFCAQVAAQILRLDERVILQALSKLEQDHWLVREHSETEVGDHYLNRYQFSHIVFQHYLYRQLSQGERRLLHRSVAEALADLYQQHVSTIAVQLAHHYTQARVPGQAAAYHLIAGDQAMKGVALDQAIRYYRAALAGWPVEDEAKRAATLRKLGECLLITGQISAALEELQSCYALWERLGNRIEAGAVQRSIGRLYWEQGERATSLQHYHRALSILEGEPESVELAQAISSISQMHMLASEYDTALAWGERALALAKRLGAQNVVVHATNNIGVSLTNLSRFDQGVALLRDSLQQSLSLHLPHDASRAYVNLGVALIWHGDYADAESTFDELLAYTTQAGTSVFQGTALKFLTQIEWWQGRWASALRRSLELAKWHNEFSGATMSKVWAGTLLGMMYNDLGQPEIARCELESELNTARSLNEAQTTVPHLGELARSMTSLGRVDEAEALVEEILTLLKRTQFNHANTIPSILFAFRWTVQNRNKASPSETASNLLHYLEQIDAQLHSHESQASLAEARGIEAMWKGQPAVAVAHFQQAVAEWGKLNRPYDEARTHNLLGRVLLLTGEAHLANSAIASAQRLIETLAAQLEDDDLRQSFLNAAFEPVPHS